MRRLSLVALAGLLAACASPSTVTAPSGSASGTPGPIRTGRALYSATAPSPDPRVGLAPGLFDAEEAIWNLRKLSSNAPPEAFLGVTNSDLAFKGTYAFQGNYNGVIVWDLSNPASPQVVTDYVCPASQSDVSVYGDLMFVSGEGLGGRLDCGTEGVQQAVSQDRLRGIRIFDITDIRNPEYIANVQTCRGSHTHSVLVDPDDTENVYIYVSGSAGVRPAEELSGCVSAAPDEDPNSALFRIEVIQVPLANPASARIVSSPRIFDGLVAPERHGQAPGDIRATEEARARGAFVVEFDGNTFVISDGQAMRMLRQAMQARGAGEDEEPTAADSAAVRAQLDAFVAQRTAEEGDGPRPGPTQCHDITLYPEIGLAGGACEGYGLLLDISNPVAPRRIQAVADSNFSYWHSATFNNDGSKVLFSDEWGGGGQAKCRADDPMEWGADAIFTLENGEMDFQGYYKMPAPQTVNENCVAHNGSLIPIPGRDVMVQSWYQGGVSVFDWTAPAHPFEIAFHDRGPSADGEMGPGGTWSVYWYNGLLVSSEIARGLDVFELTPSGFLSENEIAASKTVRLDYLNAQGQPQFVWPASFALARAYVDQLERSGGLSTSRIAAVRTALTGAESASGTARRTALTALATALASDAASSGDGGKVQMLADAVRDLAN